MSVSGESSVFMQKKYSYFLLASLAFVMGCLATGCNESETVTLTILHTNDIHSQMHAPKSKEFGLGGLARLKTKVDELRATNATTLLLDAGDWSEGTWYFNLDTGANMLRLFDAIGYDAVVVGNHDYLAGPERLMAAIDEAGPRFPVLGANFDASGFDQEAEFLEHVPKTAVLIAGDLKVGVIGLTLIDSSYSDFLDPVKILDPVAEAQAQADALKDQVDVLIALSHNSFDVNQHIAEAVYGLDAVVSGHSHKKVAQAVLMRNAGKDIPVVETGEWGTFLGELKLKVDKKAQSVTYESYALHPISADLPEDASVAALINEEDARLADRCDCDPESVVTETHVDLLPNMKRGVTLGDLVVKGYRTFAMTDVALEFLALTGVGIPAGPVTTRDLHDAIPHIYDASTGLEWTVKIWNARGQDLGLLANVFYTGLQSIQSPQTQGLAADGMEVIWEPIDGPEKGAVRVVEIEIGSEPLDLSRRYSVAVTEGVLIAARMVNDLFGLGMDLSQVTDTGEEAWRSVLDYAQTHASLGLSEGLSEEALRANGRSMPLAADPAVFAYAMGFEKEGETGALWVRVSNEGLETATGVALTCSHGILDDVVEYGTDTEAPYNEIGERLILGDLEAGASVWVDFAWDQEPGNWPVECQVTAGVDAFADNSIARRVIRKLESTQEIR